MLVNFASQTVNWKAEVAKCQCSVMRFDVKSRLGPVKHLSATILFLYKYSSIFWLVFLILLVDELNQSFPDKVASVDKYAVLSPPSG